MMASLLGIAPKTAAQAATASSTCASYATRGRPGEQRAFNPVCNADEAYLASQRGTSFSPWSSYDQDTCAKYIDPAQGAVTKLTSGTVTSAKSSARRA
jgi:hypothetical protein